MSKTILFLFGTRPEAIKMAPLISQLSQPDTGFNVNVCVTAQHRSMLDQVLEFFKIKPDYDLDLMKPSQSLFDITINCLQALEPVLSDCNPDLIVVQGDTTTTFMSALSGFYKQIKIAHIEAGLRSYNKYSPFPEEINRKLTGHIADFHFAPTEKALNNLVNEGISENVWNVGNTVIDALFRALDLIRLNGDEEKLQREFSYVDFDKKIILVTGHRRESFGKPFIQICNALKEIAYHYPDVGIIYPVHLNPNVRKPVEMILNDVDNIYLTDPLDYPSLVWLMKQSTIVLTDSGGIQEEAPSLGKPVLVMRDVTERTEGIEAGTAKLVGTDTKTIVNAVRDLLESPAQLNLAEINPYGDGHSSERICKILQEQFQL